RGEPCGDRRNLVLREAFEAIGDESVEAPVARARLEPEARAVQIGVLPFVKVERQLLGRAFAATIGRALEAQQITDARAADRQGIDERIARRAGGGRAEHRGKRQRNSRDPVGLPQRQMELPYFYECVESMRAEASSRRASSYVDAARRAAGGKTS